MGESSITRPTKAPNALIGAFGKGFGYIPLAKRLAIVLKRSIEGNLSWKNMLQQVRRA